MSTKRKITINAASAVIQVSLTAIVYFFLYRYLLKSLGVEQLGVWSLILSFSSIANLANLGLTSGLVKFVAECIALDQKEKLGNLIFTSIISMTVLFGILSVVILLCAKYFLLWVVEPRFLSIGLAILPYSLGCLSLNAIAGIFTSVLEGYQKNYLRNAIYIFSSILMLVLTILFTPQFHLIGVAMAQLFQAIFVLVSALIFISKVDTYNRLKYWSWSYASFKELFDYGYKFQIVSISQMFYEPTTKFLLSKFGGLAMVGYYEMASRLLSQVRALIVNANQVVVPIVAESAMIKTEDYRRDFFVNTNRIVGNVTFFIFSCLIILTPLISNLWIGFIESNFVFFIFVLSFAWIINILSTPSYFNCLGEGYLTIPIYSHVSIAILNFVFGYGLVKLFDKGSLVVVAWALSLIIGSILTIYMYQKQYSLIPFNKIFRKIDYLIALYFVVLASLFYLTLTIFSFNNTALIITTTVLLIVNFAVFLIFFSKDNSPIKRLLLSIRGKIIDN